MAIKYININLRNIYLFIIFILQYMTEDISKLKKTLEEKKKELMKLEKIKHAKNKTNKNNLVVVDTNYLTDDEDYNNDEIPKMYCKLGNKKTICVYGIRNRLPISLRPEQWERLYQFMQSGELHRFIKTNQERLAK